MSADFLEVMPPAPRIAIISCSCGVAFGGSIILEVLFAGTTPADAEGFTGNWSAAVARDDGGSSDIDREMGTAVEVSPDDDASTDLERSGAFCDVVESAPPAFRMAIISCSCRVNLGGVGCLATGRSLAGCSDAKAAAAGLAWTASIPASDSELADDILTGS